MVAISRALFTAYKTTSPKNLYKYLLRSCDSLINKNAIKFYKENVRKEFEQHRLESDKERVQQIMDRALADAEWILKKYTKK